MTENLIESLKKSVHEAIEHAESQCVIRKLQPNEKLPMDLLLLADPAETSIEKYIHKSKVYVAVEETLVAGVCVLMEIAPSKTEIMNVAVAETRQGKGVGKALVLHAIKSARELGMKSIEIGTGNSSIQQLALYQKCGFRLKEIIHDYFVDNYEERIFENGIQCRDMVRLELLLHKAEG